MAETPLIIPALASLPDAPRLPAEVELELEGFFHKAKMWAGHKRNASPLRDSSWSALPEDYPHRIAMKVNEEWQLILGIRPDATERDVESGLHTFITLAIIGNNTTVTHQAINIRVDREIREIKEKSRELARHGTNVDGLNMTTVIEIVNAVRDSLLRITDDTPEAKVWRN